MLEGIAFYYIVHISYVFRVAVCVCVRSQRTSAGIPWNQYAIGLPLVGNFGHS
jgi:hypothetical protein